jgi:translation initiation factor 3 subunit K
MLRGIERYNPENLTRLELYVEEQAAENHYDLEANLAILKLYQFNPHCFRADVVVNILLKALTNLPRTDFIICKCLIDMQLADESDGIRDVIVLHNLLETCHFKEFWVSTPHPSLSQST